MCKRKKECPGNLPRGPQGNLLKERSLLEKPRTKPRLHLGPTLAHNPRSDVSRRVIEKLQDRPEPAPNGGRHLDAYPNQQPLHRPRGIARLQVEPVVGTLLGIR